MPAQSCADALIVLRQCTLYIIKYAGFWFHYRQICYHKCDVPFYVNEASYACENDSSLKTANDVGQVCIWNWFNYGYSEDE